MSRQDTRSTEYDLESVKLPRLSGLLLRLLVRMMEGPLSGLISPSLLRSAGIETLRKQIIDESPTLYPIAPSITKASGSERVPENELPAQYPATGTGFHFNTIHDYARAYREGKTTPSDVARKVLEAIEDSDKKDKPLRAFIAVNREDVLKQAEEATERFKNGKPLSLLDGVPVSIKDQFDMVPYGTTNGTSFMGSSKATEDATVVARLRAAGALLTGKTNMHELGMGITGLNPHHGVARNPYNPGHHTGGSSSGSAAAVAAGLGPVSIGADGGGSIRIPSSFCGLVGLKPTYRRVSEYGDAPLGWSVDHTGPIAVTATDAAITYATIAGPDPKDPMSLNQPAPTLKNLENTDLSDLTLGVYLPWFRHASADTVSACEALLQELVNRGAKTREIVIPDLRAGQVAHTVTIAAEICHAIEHYHARYHRAYGLDLRLNLGMTRKFTVSDYIQSQRVRTRMINDFDSVLKEVDVIITPTTGIPAPPVPEDTLPQGESDLSTLFEIMRFVTPANFTGLPAISFPAGYNNTGLPIGIQVIGRAWQEHTLLRLALVSEKVVERKAPEIYYNLLET